MGDISDDPCSAGGASAGSSETGDDSADTGADSAPEASFGSADSGFGMGVSCKKKKKE